MSAEPVTGRREVAATFAAHWPDEPIVTVGFAGSVYVFDGATPLVVGPRSRLVVRAMLEAAIAQIDEAGS